MKLFRELHNPCLHKCEQNFKMNGDFQPLGGTVEPGNI